MKLKHEYTVSQLTRLFLIFLFVYTSVNKLLSLNIFKQSMMTAHIPEGLASIISVTVPVSELLLALLLLINHTKNIGLYGSLSIMLVFTGYIIYMKLFLPKIPCSCGGIIQKLTWNQHLLLNIIFIFLIYYVVRIDKSRAKQNHYFNKQVTS